MTFTREQIEATWAKYGTGEPLSKRKIDGMLRVLNEPLRLPEKPITLCGERGARPFYSFRNCRCTIGGITMPLGAVFH